MVFNHNPLARHIHGYKPYVDTDAIVYGFRKTRIGKKKEEIQFIFSEREFQSIQQINKIKRRFWNGNRIKESDVKYVR